MGNRTSLTSTVPLIPSAGTINYDAIDRSSSDSYDNNGNATVVRGQTNTYDFENRLVQRGNATVVYDGDGTRVAETVAGVTTRFLVDDLNPTGTTRALRMTTKC